LKAGKKKVSYAKEHGSGPSPNDAKLLNYVRGNAQRIVASISFAASRAGEQQRWSEVNDYLAIANQLSP
jgi:hypothetical protein